MSVGGRLNVLLAAYPARLRRKHGAELVGTLAEMAGPGGVPSAVDRFRFVLDGLRERLRPPARRPLARLAVVLGVLLGGAVGAAGGSWLGVVIHHPLPQAAQLARIMFPDAPTDDPQQTRDYLAVGVYLPAGADGRSEMGVARQRLAAAGWQTTWDNASRRGYFTAVRDGAQIEVDAFCCTTYPAPGIIGYPARGESFTVITVAGTLLGLLCGWLTSVALAHRIRVARHRRAVIGLTAAGLLLALVPVALFVASLVWFMAVDQTFVDVTAVHALGLFHFGPSQAVQGYLSNLMQLEIPGHGYVDQPYWGFGLIAIAAILAVPRRSAESSDVRAA